MDVYEQPWWSTGCETEILQMAGKLLATSLIKIMYIIIEANLLEVHDYIPHDKNKRLYSSAEIPSKFNIILTEEHTYYKKYATKVFPRFSSLSDQVRIYKYKNNNIYKSKLTCRTTLLWVSTIKSLLHYLQPQFHHHFVLPTTTTTQPTSSFFNLILFLGLCTTPPVIY